MRFFYENNLGDSGYFFRKRFGKGNLYSMEY